MTFAKIALIGAAIGTIGPIAWQINGGPGPRNILLGIFWYLMFPSWILFLGFPQAETTPYGELYVKLFVGAINVVLFAFIAVAIASVWRLVAR